MLIPLFFVLQSAGAYQVLHEPDIIYIEYVSKENTLNTIGMYESAADTLIKNVGEICFQKTEDTGNFVGNKYLLLNGKGCDSKGALFYKVLEFYEEVLKLPQHKCIDNVATKMGYVNVVEEGRSALKHISIEVNKVKKIITELNIVGIEKK